MITLLGVGHVFDIGRAVRAEILSRRPQPRPRGFSVLGLLAQFQVRIANQYGVRVGDEMVAAARAAEEIGSDVALIDQDSAVILRRVWREMAGRERLRLLVSMIGGFFTRRERVEAELQRFYQDEQGFIREFARELPTAKRILIDERDAGMARGLRQLAETRGDVVAVVGEGHVNGLRIHLEGAPVQVVHLEQLRSPPAGPNASVNVSVQL